MKWLGKHPVFSDLLIGGVLLTPPDNQYSYELTLPNDDGTAGQVLTTDGNGVLTWVTNSAGGTGVSMTNGVDNRIMTATGAQDITGEANLTYNSSTSMMVLSSASAANLPAFILINDHAGTDGGTISFQKIQDGSDNDEVGQLTWQSDDDAGGAFNVGHITGYVADASNNDEAGKIELKVMTDGTGAQQGLTATGSGTTEQVDVSIAHGVSSTTAIAGELTLGVDLAIAHGGTGQSTAQAAIDALTQVSGASAGQRLTKDGSGNATWANATTGTTLNGTTAGGVATYASANTLDIEPNFTWDGSDLNVASSVSQKPQLTLGNTNSDNKPPSLKFLKDKGAAGADLDYVGTINWYGDNSAQTQTQFGQIRNRIVTALATDEASSMEIKVAGSNGTTSQLRNMITGTGHGTNDTVNVSLGYGATSATTIAGTLVMGSTASMTNAGLLSVGNQSNITGLGTISSGVWEGTAIGVAHGGTGLTTVGTNELVTGNGTSALTSESTLVYDSEVLTVGEEDNGDWKIKRKDLTSGDDDGGAIKLEAGSAYGTDEKGGFLKFQTGAGRGQSSTGLDGYIDFIPTITSASTGSSANLTLWTKYRMVSTSDQTRFQMFAGGTSYPYNSYFTIQTLHTTGTTYLKTIDGTGTGGDMYLNADGALELISASGEDITLDSGGDIKIEPATGSNILLDGTVTVDGGSVTGITTLGVDSVSITAVQTSGETFADNDTSIMTSAAIDDRIPDEVVSTGTHVLKQTKVTIDQAGCNALNSAPQTLVAAQGANKIIIPVEVTCLVDRNAPDTSLGDLIVGWNGTTSYTYALKYSRRWMYGILTDMTFVLGTYAGKGAASLTGGENVALTIATSTGMTTNSLTSMTVYTSYYVIDNS